MNKVNPLSEIVQGFLINWSQDNRAKTGLALYYWPKVIGDELKTKAEAVQVRNGILWIKTPDPSLAYNLTFFKKEIINKYQKYLGAKTIRSVRVTIGDLTDNYDYGKKGEDSRGSLESIKIPSIIDKEMKQIKDPELKKVFANFYKRHESIKKRP
ncbi:MAG TPA: hypothetical protein DDW93_09660 [Firmicutes bacterium]|nr:hypothetical protein [Bacillota bacterium]HBK67898.1 hypothetical protein [Bacillota bacterium]HBT15621.1 hypothetical protein [Bacillota bacterium]